MEVGDGFAGEGAVVDDEAEAFGEAELFRHEVGDVEEVAKHGFIGGGGFGDARDGALGDDEEVDGRLGLDVVEDDTEVVFVFEVGGDLAVDDALEDGFHGEVAGSE